MLQPTSQTNTETTKLNIKAAIFSTLVSSVLFSIKITTGLVTGSIAILASALDSAFDFLSSSVNFYAIKHAAKPADAQHRFGHGKAEALAGFVQSIIIFGSAGYLIYESFQRFFTNNEVSKVLEGIIVMAISIALTVALVSYQSYVHKKSKSIAIAADRLHYITDILANAVVIVALLASKLFNWQWVDPAGAMIIAIYIIKSSIVIFRQSFDILMDKDISDRYRDDLKSAMKKVSAEILGYHDLRSRSAGGVDFMEFHMEVPKDMTVKQSHDVVERTMIELQSMHPNLELIIHTDPAELDKNDGKVKIFDRDKPRFY
ncbi:MAG: cation diffusion facilitator family transporter [Leptospirales bacterium]